MIKKNLKLFTILLIILTIISSFSLCFADETNEKTAKAEESTSESTDEKADENVYNGDLYIAKFNVNMDQLVDGNVYIIGNNVKISGQVNGNLFVLANSVEFDNCYIRYTVYARANNIYYNGACNDLYVATKNLEMSYDSYVVRDVKATADTTVLKAAIGRNVDLSTNSVDFGQDKEVPIIYGNLKYSANSEQALADGIVEGEVNYSNSSYFYIFDIIAIFATAIVTVLVIYALANKVKPDYIKSISIQSPIQLLKAFFIGLGIILLGIILSIILLVTYIGSNLAAILALVLILIGLLSVPMVVILVTNFLKPILKIEKEVLYYAVLALVSIVLTGLTFIPFYVGKVILAIIVVLGYGLIVSSILPKKELSEEDLQAILAKKEEKKALKEAKKIEKAQAKSDKKAAKENKKFNNE